MEHAVFYRFNEDVTILAVDVDDITIAGNSPRAVKRLKKDSGSWYGIKDMGNLIIRHRNQKGLKESDNIFLPDGIHPEDY